MLVTVALLGLVCGCRDRGPSPTVGSTEPSSPTAIVHGPERSVEVLSDPARFVCEEAGQCVNSCGYGAVNAAWLARAETQPGFRACKDGCADQLAASPRCEARRCVAYRHDPHDERIVVRHEECTSKN